MYMKLLQFNVNFVETRKSAINMEMFSSTKNLQNPFEVSAGLQNTYVPSNK